MHNRNYCANAEEVQICAYKNTCYAFETLVKYNTVHNIKLPYFWQVYLHIHINSEGQELSKVFFSVFDAPPLHANLTVILFPLFQ